MKEYYTYIMSSISGVLYVGVTNNLERRVLEHKFGTTPSFTNKYQVNRLVYYEIFSHIKDAIQNEKMIKGWKRNKKIALIKSVNPNFLDLGSQFFLKKDGSSLSS